MQANPKPIDLKRDRQLCQYASEQGYRSVEALKDALGKYVIVIEAHVGCGDKPSLYLECPKSRRRGSSHNGFTRTVREALQYDTKEAAEKRAKSIVEPHAIMTLADACCIVYLCREWDLRQAEKMKDGKSPSALAICDARIRFFGEVVGPNGEPHSGYAFTPQEAVTRAFAKIAESHAESVAAFERIRKIAKAASRGESEKALSKQRSKK